MGTRLPACNDLHHQEDFNLFSSGSVLVGDKIIRNNDYCISGPLLWYCHSALNRYVSTPVWGISALHLSMTIMCLGPKLRSLSVCLQCSRLLNDYTL